MPTKEEMQLNGSKYTDITISDYAFPSKLDKKLFEKP